MYFSSDAHIYIFRFMTSLRKYICTLQVTPIPSVLPWMCVTKSIYFPINGDTQEVHFDLSLQNNTGVTQEVRMYFLSDAQNLMVKPRRIKNNEEMFPNLSKILRKSTSGPSLCPLLEPLWSLLGSILGTCSQKMGF